MIEAGDAVDAGSSADALTIAVTELRVGCPGVGGDNRGELEYRAVLTLPGASAGGRFERTHGISSRPVTSTA